MSVTEPIYIPTAATQAAIEAAITLASSSARIKLPKGRIALTSALVLRDGIILEGTPWMPDYRGGQTTSPGGTTLVGDGTFNGVQYNHTDLSVAPTVYNDFIAGMLKGAGVMDVTFENFLYGIKIGGKYNPGIQGGRFERCNFIHCAQWGAWFENYWECEFNSLNAVNCTVGGIKGAASGASAMNCGNSRWYGTSVTTAATLKARGISFEARFSSQLNNEISLNEGVQRTTTGLSAISQAATMSNGSANITITDGTAFAVDMPVQVSATANGFTVNTTYFVASIATNVITLTNTMGYGTAIQATGNSAVNIISRGFALLEEYSSDGTGKITGSLNHGLDLEGFASMTMLVQRSFRHEKHGSFIDAASGNNQYVTVVSRGSTGHVQNGDHTTFDEDATSFHSKLVWTSGSVFSMQIQGELNFQSTTGTLKVAGTARLDYNSTKTGKWYTSSNLWLGTSTAANAASGDFLTGVGTTYGLSSQHATSANGNVAHCMNQGSGDGSNGNTFLVGAIVGSNADGSYGSSTTVTGRNSGDYVFHSFWSSSYKPVFVVPRGTSDFTIRPAASATPGVNGDMVWQLTNNTTLVVKVKGSDGTVRSATLTLS